MSSFIEEQVLDIREIARAVVREELEQRSGGLTGAASGEAPAPTSQGGTVPSTAPSLRSLEVGADLNGDAAGGAADARPSDLGKTVASPPSTWSEEQKRAALSVAGAPSVHATCKEIARVAPLFVEQREIDVLFDGPPGPEAGRFVEVEEAATGRSISFGNWIPPSVDGYWRLRFDAARPSARPRAVPSDEEIGTAILRSLTGSSKSTLSMLSRVSTGWQLSREHMDKITAAVRALCIGEQGDGASVPGDSGLKAGHNMERGSGCPASDHHADRETSTPQGPKDPAPSPAPAAPFAPDREALANLMQLALAKHPNDAVAPLHDCRQDIIALRYRQADAAIASFAPIVAERDAIAEALRPVVGSPQVERSLVGAVEAALRDRRSYADLLAQVQEAVGPGAKESDPLVVDVRKLREDRDYLHGRLAEAAALLDKAIPERERLRDRVADLERKQTWGVAIEKAAQVIAEMGSPNALAIERVLRQNLHELPEKPSPTAKRVTVDTAYLENEVRRAMHPHIPLVWSADAESKLAEVAVATVLSICSPGTAKRSVTGQELERLVHEWLDREPSIQDRLQSALAAVGIEVAP
jgi:hypothetical protein